MTKLNQFKDQAEIEQKIQYVDEIWSAWRETRLQTLSRITNYLFILNTGALLAALTYVASKSANNGIHTSIWLFSVGIFCSVAHATLDYYLTENSFTSYRKDVKDFYESNLDWEVFVERNEDRPPLDWLLHIFGWSGGIVFFAGLIIGICQIPNT